MARINTRASSAANPDDDDVRRLDQARNQNDQKLKSRFERIFRKYEHNFEGVGDEIDIHSGQIVVDNGHLQNMRDEADPGKSASSRFVRTFQEKLEHEDQGEEDGDEEENEEVDSGEDDDEADGGESGEENVSDDGQSVIEPFRALTRPPPRLAQLLVGGSGVVEDSDDQTSQEASVAEERSGRATPAGLLEQIPALQESMSALTGRSRRPAVDASTIQALGTTIANQLAQLMAGSSKPLKKRKRSSQPRFQRVATDPVWDYPDIINKANDRLKRKRSLNPVVPPPISSPPIASPGQRSLWAPQGTHRAKRFKEAATPSLGRLRSSAIPSSAVRGSELKRCMNCSLTNSSAWQAGPHGGDMCVSCGKYYEHHGRMKPFDSPTPSLEERDYSEEPISAISLGEPVSEISPEEPVIASVPTIDANSTEEIITTLDGDQNYPRVPFGDQNSQTPPPSQNEPLEAPIVQSIVTPVPPDASAADISTAAPQSRPNSEDPPDGIFILETPETYPANTSRTVLKDRFHAYSVEEDAHIIKLKELDDLKWDIIAAQFPHRTLYSVQNRYTRTLHQNDGLGRDLFNAQQREQQDAVALSHGLTDQGREFEWSHEQDELLLELREQKVLDWTRIASVLPGHSAHAVKRRYKELVEDAALSRENKVLTPCKGWSPSEDARIVRLKEVDKLGWHQVAERFEDRTIQSIQKRYSRFLSPDQRQRAASDPTKGTAEEWILDADSGLAAEIAPGWRPEPPFEPAEDALIKALVEEAKMCDWEVIAAQLPGRSVRSVFTRYTRSLKSADRTPVQPEPSQPESVTPPTDTGYDRWIAYSPLRAKHTRRTDAPPYLDDFAKSQVVPPRTSTAVWQRSKPVSREPFTQDEDNVIMQLRASSNASWEDISLRLSDRSGTDVANRFSELLRARTTAIMTSNANNAPSAASSNPANMSTKPNTRPRVRPYTPEEDDLIARLRAENMSWQNMAQYFGDRTSGGLREHWHSKLKPKARKSLPVQQTVLADADLLRAALNNSRRRSDALPRENHSVVKSGHGNSAIDATTLEDDVEMAAASEQLFEEFRSSVAHEPSPVLQIDPQLLEVDRIASNAQGLDRLMLEAARFAVEHSDPRMVQQIDQAYFSRADISRPQQVLEPSRRDGAHIPPEVARAFEAFDHACGLPGRSGHSLVTASEKVPEMVKLSTRGKRKEGPLEDGLTPRSLHAPTPVEAPRPQYMPLKHHNQAKKTNTSVQSAMQSDIGTATAAAIFAHPVQAPPPAFAPPDARTLTSAGSRSRHISYNHDEHNTEPLSALLPTSKPAKKSSKQVSAKPPARENSTQPLTSLSDRQPQSLEASGEPLAAPSCPKHSMSELIHKAFDATQSSALHPKSICSWVENNFEHYGTATRIWKSEIIKELKGNDDFEQCGAGKSAPWRVKIAGEPETFQSVKVRNDVGPGRESPEAATFQQADLNEDEAIPCSYKDAIDGAPDPIVVKPPPRKRGRPRGKRTTASVKHLQDYTPIGVTHQVPAAKAQVPVRGRPDSLPNPVRVQKTATTLSAPVIDLTIEIADSDGEDELSSSPVQKPPLRTASSGKKVRFTETVKVRGPACASVADTTPASKKPAWSVIESDTREPIGSSSSPAKVQVPQSSAEASKVAVPSSSPVFMKPALPSIKAKPAVSPASSFSTPIPRSKSRLSQLRRETTSAAATAPETPKTSWPRRHSTPTAIFSHRASPAPGRSDMVDRFGFGRKRVVETPVRELMKRKDMEEDELA